MNWTQDIVIVEEDSKPHKWVWYQRTLVDLDIQISMLEMVWWHLKDKSIWKIYLLFIANSISIWVRKHHLNNMVKISSKCQWENSLSLFLILKF